MIQLRPYQTEAIDAVLDYWSQGGGNPLVDLATGLGKSIVIAKLTRDLLTQYPDMNVLMLVHVRELVQQNAMALLKLWPEAPIGIYSAGLGRRDTHRKIIFGSVQSLFRQDGHNIGHRDLVLIDEAHLVPAAGEGMYRTLLDKLRRTRPDMRVCGFTATPFRMDTGRLDAGNDRLFDEIVYSYGIRAGIEAGFLSPLVSKNSATQIDTSSVAKRGGEYIPGALEAAANKDVITQAAVDEMIRYGSDRKSWLVFCTGVQHAHDVRDVIRSRGISCETITGDTPSQDRARFIADFKAGRIRCLTNANVLTTGFDAPATDLIAMLRPTLSTGLYVQMCGRGTRLADGKANCLVLDFAGVVRRHGPVDTVEVASKGKKATKEDMAVKDETVRAKECPDCSSLVSVFCRTCPDCGHEWPFVETPKHEAQAGDLPILSTDPKLSKTAKRLMDVDDVPVLSWSAGRHCKLGSPDSMKVTYLAGLLSYPEWVALEHKGFAADKAARWWRRHGGAEPVPVTVADALERFGELRQPSAIQVRKNKKWWDIVGRRFDDNQEKEEAA